MAKPKMDIALKRCITPKFRASFPVLFTPKSFQDQPAKYSLVMLFDKKTDLKELKRAAHNAAVEAHGKDKTQWPKNFKMPFRDGNEKSDTKGYAGTVFVTASSKNQPGVIDNNKEPVLNERDFYAGCYARAEIIAFAYDTSGNRGVSFSLQNVQKLGDGAKFGGRKDAEDVFDAVEDSSDDEDSYGSDDDAEDDEDNQGF